MPGGVKQKQSARESLIEAAVKLFYEQGYSATTVRQICSEAEAGVNMVSYYFGSKEGLYKEILDSFSNEVFMSPLKTLAQSFDRKEEFVKILEIFANQTLDGFIAQRMQYVLVRREKVVSKNMMKYQQGMVDFFERAKTKGVVRQEVDSAMVTGLIAGRLAEQVENADWIKKVTGVDIVSDTDYRQRWISANIDIFVNGILSKS